MNLFIIIISAVFSGKRIKIHRVLLGSAFGALAGCLMLVFRIPPIWLRWILNYIVINFVMIFIAFSVTGLKECLSLMAMSYAVSFFAGGVLSSIAGHLAAGRGLVLSIMVILTLMGILFLNKIKSSAGLAGMLYDVSLTYHGNTVCLKGLYDTGNRLKDPVTGKSVSLCEFAAVKELFTAEEIYDITYLLEKELKSTMLLHVIPYHAVGTKDGLLAAVVMDETTIHYTDSPYRVKNPLVALYMGNISADTEVQFIIHKNWRSLC